MMSNSSLMKACLPQQQEFCVENNQLQLEYTTTEWEIYTKYTELYSNCLPQHIKNNDCYSTIFSCAKI